MVDEEKRKKIISDLMEYSNFTRPQAETAAAIELGEIEGDALEVEDESHIPAE